MVIVVKRLELITIHKTVTDHRIGFTIQRLDAVIEGKLDLVISELIAEDQRRKLAGEKE